MSEEVYQQESSCSHDCSSCASSCGSKQPSKEDFLVPMNQYSRVRKVIGVVSGKGGVGKSFVTSYLSVLFNRKGYKTAILDADVTGPSIPKAFGIHKLAEANELGLLPEITKNGIELMSVNLLLENEETPVVWRGPVIASTVKQFWSEVVWGDVDYMFVDMPPGTGDVPLTVFQSLPLDGIIVLTSPQELVSMIVGKAVNMAKEMNIPILGLVENYSYIECGNCKERISVFGKSHIDEISKKYGIPVLAKLPIDPSIAEAIDGGNVEDLQGSWLDEAADTIAKILPVETAKKSEYVKIAVASTEAGNVSEHFGHCENFTVYELEGDTLLNREVIKNTGSGHEEVANLMKELGVNVVICGGIGAPAMSLLMEYGILVVPGMQGDVDIAAAAYLDGAVYNGEMDSDCDSGACSSCAGNCGKRF